MLGNRAKVPDNAGPGHQHQQVIRNVNLPPVKTLAGAAISGARHVFRYSEDVAPLKFNPQLTEVGSAALYLASDLSSGVTGNIHHVDGGLHSVAIPKQEDLI